VIIVETVGLGQSEVELEQAVDLFCLLVSPGGGDDLQASKKGVMEAVDLLLVSKADGDLLRTAKHTKADYGGSLSLIRKKSPLWSPRAQLISSRTGLGVDTFLDSVSEFHTIMVESGQLDEKRSFQAKHWMWAQFKNLVVERVKQSSEASSLANELEGKLMDGTMSSRHAAGLLLKKTFGLS
jgi:LAO/AO transport system kinase